MQHENNLVWIDLEMTGLCPDTDVIIEIASIITDSELNTLAEGPVIAVKQSLTRLAQMNQWNTRTHTESGLVNRIKASTIHTKDAEKMTLDFIRKYVPGNHAPLCGNSICQDRRFLYRQMPKLEAYLHYRNLDVSSIKELVKRWRPDLVNGFAKQNTHRALDDIRESIEELKYYRRTFLRAPPPDS